MTLSKVMLVLLWTTRLIVDYPLHNVKSIILHVLQCEGDNPLIQNTFYNAPPIFCFYRGIQITVEQCGLHCDSCFPGLSLVFSSLYFYSNQIIIWWQKGDSWSRFRRSKVGFHPGHWTVDPVQFVDGQMASETSSHHSFQAWDSSAVICQLCGGERGEV